MGMCEQMGTGVYGLVGMYEMGTGGLWLSGYV